MRARCAQLNGSGNGTLVWSPIFGLSDPNIPNPTANPEATTIYTLTVTGGNLCTNTDQTTVTVNVLPNANAGPDLLGMPWRFGAAPGERPGHLYMDTCGHVEQPEHREPTGLSGCDHDVHDDLDR